MDRNQQNRILIWMPRVLAIAFILFISIFAFDSFSSEIPLGQSLIRFLIHLIPSFVLLAVLVIAWQRPVIGGWIFIIIAIALSIFWGAYRDIFRFLLLTLPLLVTGILFIISGNQLKHRSGQD